MDLEEIAPIIQAIIKETLTEKRYPFGYSKNRGIGNKVSSGGLRNSVEVVVKTGTEGEQVMDIMMLDYWQWVQSGRLPGKKGVPIDKIEQWIKDRGILGRDAKGKFIKRRSFAFAIQNNIKKFGIRPANFIDASIEKIEKNNKIIELLGDATLEDLINTIEGI